MEYLYRENNPSSTKAKRNSLKEKFNLINCNLPFIPLINIQIFTMTLEIYKRFQATNSFIQKKNRCYNRRSGTFLPRQNTKQNRTSFITHCDYFRKQTLFIAARFKYKMWIIKILDNK